MLDFFKELTRRNIFRVAAAYVIVGWIVLQVVSVLMPALHLPDWMPSVAFTILLIGFPLALFLAWAFELTPEGVRAASSAGEETTTTGLRRTELALVGVAILLVAGTLLWSRNDMTGTVIDAEGNEAARFSVAVLPLNNLSDEGELTWIADGLSEDITTQLASTVNLNVAARNSAFAWKGTSPDIREVGEDLGVRFVLEGSLRKIGDSVRLTAQLIESASGAHVWTDRYDHRLDDLAHMQDTLVNVVSADVYGAIYDYEIAEIANLPPEEMTTKELATYAFELAINRFSPDLLDQGIKLANLALERDPGNVKAHTVLAVTFAWAWAYGVEGSKGFDVLADKHARAAYESAPHDFFILSSMPAIHMALGKPEECMPYADRVVELFPRQPEAWSAAFHCHTFAAEYEAAAKDLAMWRTLSGTRPLGYSLILGYITEYHLGLGDYAEAEKAARVAVAYDRTEWHQRSLVVALAQRGKIEEASRERVKYQTMPGAIDLTATRRLRGIIIANDRGTDAYIEGLRLAGLE